MNSVNLVGNTTREVELRYTPSGKTYARFGIAVNKRYTNKATGEIKDKPMYIDVISYAGAEVIQEYLLKGDKVSITGELAFDTWNDEKGNPRSKHYVIARAVEFLKPKPKEGSGQQMPQPIPPQEYYPQEEDEEGNLPHPL